MYTQSGSTFFIPFEGNEAAIKELKAGKIKKWDITGHARTKKKFKGVYQFFRTVRPFTKGGRGVIAIARDLWGTGILNYPMKIGYEGEIKPENVSLKMGDVTRMSRIYVK